MEKNRHGILYGNSVNVFHRHSLQTFYRNCIFFTYGDWSFLIVGIGILKMFSSSFNEGMCAAAQASVVIQIKGSIF